MTSTNGPDIPTAIREFREAGYTVAEIASDLGLHISTVYRWQAGTRRPNAKNHAALAELIDARYSQHVHRRKLTVAVMHLRAAAEALEDPAERAEFEQRMRGKRQAIVAQRRLESPSAFGSVDPFTVFGQQDREMAAVEAVGF